MANLNSFANITDAYPNVFVEGSEIYFGSKGSPKRFPLYPVTFEWFDGEVANLHWTEFQFVDAYFYGLRPYFDFIENFIKGKFPINPENWLKLCNVITDCFLRPCVWKVVKNREYELLMRYTYRIESDGRFYRNDLHPHTPIISDTIRLHQDFAWMFSPIDKGNDLRDLVVSHHAKCSEEQHWTKDQYAAIGEDIADRIIYTFVKLDIFAGVDWEWVSHQIFNIDPELATIVDDHLYPREASSAETVIPDNISLETAP